MSESTIPHFEYYSLHIWPPRICHQCDRLTAIAIYDTSLLPSFTPVCPLHGYARSSNDVESSDEQQMKKDSVARFVLWMHGERGRVVYVAPGEDLNAIAGYEAPLEPDNDEAWYVRYESPERERIDCWAVWSIEDSQFFLYENGAIMVEREREQVA